MPSIPTLNNDNNIFLDDAGFNFVTKCIQTVELRGLFCLILQFLIKLKKKNSIILKLYC